MGARLDEALRAARGEQPGEAGLDKDLAGNLFRAYQRVLADTDKLRRRLERVEKALGIDPDAELAAALRGLGADDGGKERP